MAFVPPSASGIKWLFLDMNSYFASVEQQDCPHLRNKPVAVVPMETDSTCAIAASYEAKAYGIKTGTKIYDAKKMCPHLHCVLARHDLYVDYHHRILSAIAGIIPIHTVWSVDELSSRLPESRRNIDNAQALAVRVKQAIRDKVGKAIKCSIGLAPNSFLAKVATDLQKPNGLVALEGKDLPGPLFDLDLMDLPGINTGIMARLDRAGIRTVEALWNSHPKQARAIWGSVAGERFWYRLRGYEVPEQETKTRMVGHSRVLDPDFRRPELAAIMARRLTSKACHRLRRKELYAGSFSLGVKTAEGLKWAREIRLEPAQDTISFLRALDRLWEVMLRQSRPRRLKKVSVILHNLKAPGERTGDLFSSCNPVIHRERARHNRLSEVMDRLNHKYGADTIHLGVVPKTLAGYVGTKIAFSRVPEMEEFRE